MLLPARLLPLKTEITVVIAFLIPLTPLTISCHIWIYHKYKQNGADWIDQNRRKVWLGEAFLPALIFGPLWEELVFRGSVLVLLNYSLPGAILGGLILNCLFALGHSGGSNGENALIHKITSFLFGLYFLVLCILFQSLFLTILLHSFTNLLINWKTIKSDPKDWSIDIIVREEDPQHLPPQNQDP